MTFSIREYLEKKLHPALAKETFYTKTKEIIQSKTNMVLSPDSISLKNGMLHINTTPLGKTEIYLKKKEILDALHELGTKYTITDIL